MGNGRGQSLGVNHALAVAEFVEHRRLVACRRLHQFLTQLARGSFQVQVRGDKVLRDFDTDIQRTASLPPWNGPVAFFGSQTGFAKIVNVAV